jgi:ABC-2 type transport system permease protein/oleandomycin transport system permease protein
MTAVSAPVDLPAVRDLRDRPPTSAIVSDALTIAKRNLIALVRTPTTLVFSTVQPVIFVLLFRYVFGGAIKPPPGVHNFHYVYFLMPGVFVQTVVFGSVNTGVGLASDLQTGIIERFRSLPMARSAVLAGRTMADLVRNLFVVFLMVFIGFLVGFRIQQGVVDFGIAILLMLGFGLAMSWIMALIGLASGNPEAAQAGAFPFMALLVFASNAFVPTTSMPRYLRDYANREPVSEIITAVRSLSGGRALVGGSATEHVLVSLAWIVGITVVFAALAVNRYRKAA